jgi:hypothetical protein
VILAGAGWPSVQLGSFVASSARPRSLLLEARRRSDDAVRQSDSESFKGFLGFRPKFYDEADDPVRQLDRTPFKGFLADDGASRFRSALKERPFFEDQLKWYEAEIAEIRRQKAELERGNAEFERSMQELDRNCAELPHLALEAKVALAKMERRGPGRPPVLDSDLFHLDQQRAAHPGVSVLAWFLAAVEEGRWSKPTSLRQAKERYNAAFNEGVKRFGWEYRLK